ncbi:MAG: FkbM family methyltransferase [Ekhidna sp.]|uniref:FkbM family methyltransferase n=1 Tax=Ekhidna sp. TaxID=2608089 RepID=UPI0032EC46E7
MNILKKLQRSITYRTSKNEWHKLAVHHEFSGYKKHSVYLESIGIHLDENKHISLLRGYSSAKKLVANGGRLFLENGVLLLAHSGLRVEIQTAEELFIACEILVDKCYEFHIAEPCLILDIGMNVGIASLYFASQKNVVAVYGFEPFEPTFKQAQENFRRNPSVSQKIKSNNIGLGDCNKEMMVDYSPSNRGRVGLFGTNLVKNEFVDLGQELIKIKSASEVLKEIITSRPSIKKVVKMDVEGAEFEIIENLYNNGILSSFDAIMMEWHKTEPTEIIHSLSKNGFTAFKQNYNSHVGMIYASKQ